MFSYKWTLLDRLTFHISLASKTQNRKQGQSHNDSTPIEIPKNINALIKKENIFVLIKINGGQSVALYAQNLNSRIFRPINEPLLIKIEGDFEGFRI